ncbi:TPA: class I SAM-dependent methyltransferase [Candidatus Poribacteria bacterium]|nr:class I SAM-dependent methyltransferase [Candidatus Poribacteria bacterium]
MKTYYRIWLEEELPKLISYRSNMDYTLDLGCKDLRYRELLDGMYVGVDVNPRVKGKDVVIADAHHLPFVDEAFSVVLATELFEHLKDPKKAIMEIYRVTKSGGELILSVPYLFPSPHEEYWRFSENGIRLLLNELFEIKVVRKIGGLFTNFFTSLFIFLESFIPKKINKIIYPLYTLLRIASKTIDQYINTHYAYAPISGILVKAKK